MKIENKTRWRTDDLRALISACLKARGVPSKGLSVTVVASRRGGRISGFANIGRMREQRDGFGKDFKLVKRMRYGTYMTLRLPQPVPGDEAMAHDLGGPTLRERFARVVEHEIAHLQGLDHSAMGEKLYYCKQETPWLGELPLRAGSETYLSMREPKAAFADKEAHARAMLAKATTRLKRATSIAKRWQRRVNYYGKKVSP